MLRLIHNLSYIITFILIVANRIENVQIKAYKITILSSNDISISNSYLYFYIHD